VIEKIAALLAKAERTDNVAEAEAYLAKAQALATQASVDLAVARARTARREKRERPTSRTVTIGEKGKRANTHLVSLFVAVAIPNDVRVDVARNSTYVIAYGMPSDLEVVEAMFGSLATQMTSAAATWLSAGEWRGESYVAIVRDPWRGRVRTTKPHTAQTARAAFYRGFVDRITLRLAEARKEAEVREAAHVVDVSAQELAEAGGVAVRGDGPVTGALVLRAKDAEVRSFYRQASSARGSWTGYSGGVTRQAGSATAAGRDAAARARLSTPRGLPAKGPGLSA
jgi:hypothetical protein